MAGWRQAVEFGMTGEEIETLTTLSRPRIEPARRVSRAAMLLAYRETPRSLRWDEDLALIIRRSSAASNGRWRMARWRRSTGAPGPGKEPVITPAAKAWLVSVACDKAKEHGYPHELCTTRLLARYARVRSQSACAAHKRPKSGAMGSTPCSIHSANSRAAGACLAVNSRRGVPDGVEGDSALRTGITAIDVRRTKLY
ncbi:hypothetical protein ACVWWI_006592 [Bradyrhizobium sp. USDA 3686]|nr:hypothetical protein [Bradyrhizobium canariense]